MRKSPAERVAEYRTRAAEIEERERRKLLGRSPAWMATKRAIANLELARSCVPDADETEHGDVVEQARNELVAFMEKVLG